MPEGEAKSAKEYDLPASFYFSVEKIEEAPVEQGVTALAEWFDTFLDDTIKEKHRRVGASETEDQFVSAILREYISVKRRIAFARTKLEGETEVETAHRQGELDALQRLMKRLHGRRVGNFAWDAEVIDALFERAESASGTIVIPSSGRLPPGQR